MLEDYIKVLRSTTGIRGVRLITHSHLQAMYERAGFTLVGESEVVHGPDKWWEMKLDFAQTESTAAPDTALEADPVDMRNPGKRIASFAAGLDDLVDRDTGSNRADLFCPRPECRCILLRAGAGKLVTAQKSDFEVSAPHVRQSGSISDLRTRDSSLRYLARSPHHRPRAHLIPRPSGLFNHLSHSRILASRAMLRLRQTTKRVRPARITLR